MPGSKMKRRFSDSARGNVMIMGVAVISLLSMFGVVLTSRMVVDANTSGKRINGSQAFYLSDAGIQWGRKYLKNGGTANTTLGPLSLGTGTVTVTVRQEQDFWLDWHLAAQTDVYEIISTAQVGNAQRQIMEIRKRGAGGGYADKQYMAWREDANDDY
jgi:Tfp pilus assembly protein PilX